MHLPAFLRRPDDEHDPVLGERTERQTRLEERINVALHFTAMVLSVVGLWILLPMAARKGTLQVAAVSIYGGTMIFLFLASCLYHGATGARSKPWLQVVDYAAVFLLIAGSYTPFALITIKGTLGWAIFWAVWFLALVGASLQPFMAGRYRVWGLLHYVATGWAIVFAMPTLMQRLPMEAFGWVFAGGMAYTIGTLFYLARQIRFSHNVWHSLVVVGTACMWIVIFSYVMPAG